MLAAITGDANIVTERPVREAWWQVGEARGFKPSWKGSIAVRSMLRGHDYHEARSERHLQQQRQRPEGMSMCSSFRNRAEEMKACTLEMKESARSTKEVPLFFIRPRHYVFSLANTAPEVQ